MLAPERSGDAQPYYATLALLSWQLWAAPMRGVHLLDQPWQLPVSLGFWLGSPLVARAPRAGAALVLASVWAVVPDVDDVAGAGTLTCALAAVVLAGDAFPASARRLPTRIRLAAAVVLAALAPLGTVAVPALLGWLLTDLVGAAIRDPDA